MARQSGILKFKGTLDGLTFYKTQDGSLVRTKGGVDKSKILNDPNFVRTRENMAEFAGAANAGKLLRGTVRTLMQNASDNRVTSRLTKVMTTIKSMDTTNARGERNVLEGLNDPNAIALLKGFDFNNRSLLATVLFAPFTIDPGLGTIAIPALIPINDLNYPQGATHVTFKAGFMDLDYNTNTSEITYSPAVNKPINGTLTSVSCVPASQPNGFGMKGHLLSIEFFQEVNGVQYSLKNGAFNVLNMVEFG